MAVLLSLLYMTECPRLKIGLSVSNEASILTCQTQNIQSPSHPYLRHSRTKAAQMASTLSIPLPPPSQPLSLSLNMTASLFNRITTSLTFNTDLRSLLLSVFLRGIGFES